MSDPVTAAELAPRIAEAVRDGFEQYHARFAVITARARVRFQQRDWAAARPEDGAAAWGDGVAGGLDALAVAGDAALTVQPQLTPNVGYDARKDFTPLRLVAAQANVLVVNASKGLPDMKTLLAQAKGKRGALTFGSAGNGSPSHLIGALFENQAGIDLVHVPYKGAAPAMTDLIGGQIDMLFVGTPVALQTATRNELLMRAVTGSKRLPSLPNVPTFAELGIGQLGSETAVWWSVMAPAGLPQNIAVKLDEALKAALNDADVQKNLNTQGVDTLNLDAKTTEQWMARDQAKWAELIRAKKIASE